MASGGSAHIRERLARLERADAAGAVSGTTGRHFRCNPVADPAVLDAAERAGGFVLPPAYRRHLIEVGDGGAGPAYGLFPFGTWGDTADAVRPIDGTWGRPGVPFPHDAAWNLPESELVPPPGLTDEENDRWFEAYDERYFATAHVDGSLPIGHLGCAMWILLVVTGDRAGEVWLDDRTSGNGILPLDPGGFASWYEDWLAEAEARTGLT